MLKKTIKNRLLNWVLDETDASLYEQIFLARPELILSVTQLPYSGMMVRFVDGREADIPGLPDGFMDQLVGFERDGSERSPTWTNIFSIIAINGAIETRALTALMQVAHRLGYELREVPVTVAGDLEHKRRDAGAIEVVFAENDEDIVKPAAAS